MAELHLSVLETPLGDMLAGSVSRAEPPGEALCLLEFHDRRALPTERTELQRHFHATWPEPGAPTPLIARVGAELAGYFAGRRKDFDLPLVTPGTPFQQRVWFHLRRIPCGSTLSYAELARRVESPGGSRAVGQANGRNRIAIIVPCHRVIDSSGGLGGYGGKLWRKEKLLELEGAIAASLV
jgi:AraC family transcriptional regulator, regulatory protein of adaptative response / methylated-DNA-[protein]-cysteine methyltransferase